MAEADPADQADVVAAGALVVRAGAVLLVHRPKYDDWSYPKGKRDPGEHEIHTAVRETVEETGVEIRLGRPLPSTAYLQGDGAAKLVHYWRGDVVGDPDLRHFVPNSEVDQVRWVPLPDAATLLSYQRDVAPLTELLRMPRRTTPLVVLRHAKALGRKRWRGADPDRPLNNLGHRQAQVLPDLLAGFGVTRVITSSSLRCRQTVQPYAEEQVLGIDPTDTLSEEHADATTVSELVTLLLADKEATVLCTHRPVLPYVMQRLALDVPPLETAEMLVVHHRKGRVVAWERHRMPDTWS